jgi:hypothetical protein
MLSSAATLTVLQLDFDPSEFGLLRCVANVAPLLTALKLIEKHQAQPPVTITISTYRLFC